jgi:hypothetical protein
MSAPIKPRSRARQKPDPISWVFPEAAVRRALHPKVRRWFQALLTRGEKANSKGN